MKTVEDFLALYGKECFSCGAARGLNETTSAELALTELISVIADESYSAGYSFAKKEKELVETAATSLSD
jgi:hypothetical protein